MKDQNAIQKLRDRVTQLDMENTALTQAAHYTTDQMSVYDAMEGENIDSIVQRIQQLKAHLKVVNEKSLKPAENIEGR